MIKIQPIPLLQRADTPEARRIWAAVDEAAKRVPEWMQAEIEATAEAKTKEIVERNKRIQQNVQRLHNEAMIYAEDASMLKARGRVKSAAFLYNQAFRAERCAAELYSIGPEPTRSILYRSAASLALECDAHKAVVELATKGLEGNPPSEIAEELQNLLKFK